MDFVLKGDYIELIKLLKSTQVAQTGGHAKIIVESGEVKVNDEVEYRKRAKLRTGDRVAVDNQEIFVV